MLQDAKIKKKKRKDSVPVFGGFTQYPFRKRARKKAIQGSNKRGGVPKLFEVIKGFIKSNS